MAATFLERLRAALNKNYHDKLTDQIVAQKHKMLKQRITQIQNQLNAETAHRNMLAQQVSHYSQQLQQQAMKPQASVNPMNHHGTQFAGTFMSTMMGSSFPFSSMRYDPPPPVPYKDSADGQTLRRLLQTKV